MLTVNLVVCFLWNDEKLSSRDDKMPSFNLVRNHSMDFNHGESKIRNIYLFLRAGNYLRIYFKKSQELLILRNKYYLEVPGVLLVKCEYLF